ncbi:MAG TPA: hypothetical protein VLW17_11520 [Thermoanaerobaculaceae bacterium]|nr:hypothetical protein [Thermoanaerobaculaceae bacterium]
MKLPPLLLLASPDDYLLELERAEVGEAWKSDNQGGEVKLLDAAPPAHRLVEEIANPSLFAPERLLVLKDASGYFPKRDKPEAQVEGAALARALAALPLTGVTVVLGLVVGEEPEGELAAAVAKRGEVRFLPLPPAPKPWEEGRVTAGQRALLEAKILRRVAPELVGNAEVVDALCEAYGFRPRELAQAAERLALSERADAESVREQAGAGECSPRQIEDALIKRDRAALARLFGTLDAGGTLTGWRGDAIDLDKEAGFLGRFLGGLLRQALEVRAQAQRAGLARELDPRRCAADWWYTKTFRPKLHKPLAAAIESAPDSALAGRSAWQLHRMFRLAAAYDEGELLAALARLDASGAERARRALARATFGALLLALVTPRAA